MLKNKAFVCSLIIYISAVLLICIFMLKSDNSINANALRESLPNDVKVTPTPTQTTTLISGNPINIEIPSVSINLPVINGSYNSASQTWTLTNNKAQFAIETVQPNNISGDTLIYGHDIPAVFANTAGLKPGDQAIVKTDTHAFIYEYMYSESVSPTDTTVLNYSGKPRLTILTCTGWFSSQRRLMYFNLVSAK